MSKGYLRNDESAGRADGIDDAESRGANGK